MANFRGVYINLDRSPERRAVIETQLRRSGLTYERFAALTGASRPAVSPLSAGEMGCFLSHAAVIGRASGSEPLHVLEDDAVIPHDFATLLSSALTDAALTTFDLIYTNVILIEPSEARIDAMLASAEAALAADIFHIIDLKTTRFARSDSYVVNPRSLTKLRAMFADEVARPSGPEWPLDHFYRRAIIRGDLRGGVVFPFITTVSGNVDSTIGQRSHPLPATSAHDVLRRAFYVDGGDRAALVAAYRAAVNAPLRSMTPDRQA